MQGCEVGVCGCACQILEQQTYHIVLLFEVVRTIGPSECVRVKSGINRDIAGVASEVLLFCTALFVINNGFPSISGLQGSGM